MSQQRKPSILIYSCILVAITNIIISTAILDSIIYNNYLLQCSTHWRYYYAAFIALNVYAALMLLRPTHVGVLIWILLTALAIGYKILSLLWDSCFECKSCSLLLLVPRLIFPAFVCLSFCLKLNTFYYLRAKHNSAQQRCSDKSLGTKSKIIYTETCVPLDSEQ